MTSSSETVFTNARIVLGDSVIEGHLRIRDDLIADIDIGASDVSGRIDCDGDYLAPGLIELHTDNLERHMSPRPGVDWPHEAAIIAHDAELAGVGITTVFDAMRVGSILTARSRYGKYARGMASEVLKLRDDDALGISHFLHLRAEICSETLIEELDEFGPEDRVGIISLMDHTPGQRQFTDVVKHKKFVCGKYGLTDTEYADHVAHLRVLQDTLGSRHEVYAVDAAKRFGAVLASHDDTTAEQVAVSAKHEVSLAEFPTTLDAARACRDNGIAVMAGAPNLIRGKSHSGNVSAADLARAGLLDILSSDYVPAALLGAAVRLGLERQDLAAGLATVTSAPAAAAGLADRGRIVPGLRADLIRFRMVGDVPQVRQTWVRGVRVA